MSIKRLTNISILTTLMIVFTLIVPSIPVLIINVNVTLQTFIVMLTGLLLRPIDAFLSILIYVLIGTLGIPVYSGYNSGIGTILGPTGGFILSFPPISYIISVLKSKNNIIINLIITIFCGIILTYICGILWLSLYLEQSLGKIIYAMLIFIPFDLLKCILATIIGFKLNIISINTGT